MSLLRKFKLQGATVVSFESRGCMAEQHRFQYLGVVVGFEKTRFAGVAARVKVIKRGEHGIDSRDRDLGIELEPIDNGSLQEMGPLLWVIVR